LVEPLTRRRLGPFSPGQLNKLTDAALHPYFKKYPVTMLLDELIHVAIEENPKQSLTKFLQYTAPRLIKQRERSRRQPQ